MAGGQERVLRRRIKSVQSTKKITKAMELIAASRIVKAQQRVAAARPYSEQITEVIRNLAAAGAGGGSPLLEPSARRSARSPTWSIAADRGLAGALQQRRSSGPPSGRCSAERAEGRQTRAHHRRQEGAGLLPLPRLRHRRRRSPGMTDKPTYEDARDGRRRTSPTRFEAGEYDQVELVYTQFLSVGIAAGRRSAGSCRSTAASSSEARRATGPTADYEFEPSPRRDPRPAAAPLRRGPALRRAARRGGVRARRPPAGHEVGHRQRRGADHQAQPGHEPGPPGRHHHRDHGDRRRRRGPARSPVRRPDDLLVDHVAQSTTSSTDTPRPHPQPPRQPQEHPNDRHRTSTDATATLKDGRVVAIAGPVVDVEFPPDAAARDQHRRSR